MPPNNLLVVGRLLGDIYMPARDMNPQTLFFSLISAMVIEFLKKVVNNMIKSMPTWIKLSYQSKGHCINYQISPSSYIRSVYAIYMHFSCHF